VQTFIILLNLILIPNAGVTPQPQEVSTFKLKDLRSTVQRQLNAKYCKLCSCTGLGVLNLCFEYECV